MRIAVISDIHSAAAPFRQALEDARAEGFDQLLLLGDLLTYGVDPLACLDLASEAIARDGAVLVGGNHDQLYVDLGAQRSAYVDRLPDWIRESVEWTWRAVGEAWPDRLDWSEEWTSQGVLFAHANPFGYGDWTYLANPDQLAAAAACLRARGYRAGVFGHLHRAKFLRDAQGVEVHVVGSVGQPRSDPPVPPAWAMVEIHGDHIAVESRPIAFDAAAHRSAIHAASGLSAETKSMLCRYFP